MKTKLCKIAAIILISIMTLSVFGCKEDMTNKFTVYVGGDVKKEYIINLDNLGGDRGFYAVLEYFKKTEKFEYTVENGLLKKLGTLEYNSAEGRSICVYTSVEEDTEKDPWTIDYKGVRYKSVGVPFEDMQIKEGMVIYIGILRSFK